MLLTEDMLIGSQAGTHAVYALEQRFNSYFGDKMLSVSMSNATIALMSVFKALELKPGDKIITTPYTWGGTIAGALFMGLNIVFADIDPNTLTLSPVSVKHQLQKHKNVKVILDVDVFGNPSLSDEINQIAKQYNCFHLIDSASGFGSFYKGKPSGYYADAVVYSFSESKNINIGEGAILLVKDFEVFEKLIFFSQHPNRSKRDAPFYPQNQFALNTRINPLSAYILNENFDTALNQISQKRETIMSFIIHIESNLGWQLFNHLSDYKPSFTRICFQLDANQNKKLKKIVKQYYEEVIIEKASISTLLYNDPVLVNLSYTKQLFFDESIVNAPTLINGSIEINFKS